MLRSISFFILLLCAPAGTQEMSLMWDPNSEQDLAGYRVHYGTETQQYTGASALPPSITSWPLDSAALGPFRYYLAVTAFDTAGNESDFSEELWANLGTKTWGYTFQEEKYEPPFLTIIKSDSTAWPDTAIVEYEVSAADTVSPVISYLLKLSDVRKNPDALAVRYRQAETSDPFEFYEWTFSGQNQITIQPGITYEIGISYWKDGVRSFYSNSRFMRVNIVSSDEPEPEPSPETITLFLNLGLKVSR